MYSGISVIATIINVALTLFIVVLWGRLILDLAQSLSRTWRPRGPMLVVAEVVFTITDPPIKFVRRFVPPLRIGNIQLDLAFSIVLLAALILSFVVQGFI